MITDSLKHQAESVGADAQMAKLKIGKLVCLIDSLINILLFTDGERLFPGGGGQEGYAIE